MERPPRPPNFSTSPFFNHLLFTTPEMLQFQRNRPPPLDILFGSDSRAHSQPLLQQPHPHPQSQPIPQIQIHQPPQPHPHHQLHPQHSQQSLQSHSQPLPLPQHINRRHQSAPIIPPPQNIPTILSGGIKEYVEKNGASNPFYAAKRVMNDLAEIEEKPLTGVYVGPANDHIHELIAVMEGPSDTVYEGGTFFVDVIIPQSYPFEPPQLKFRTRIYHPNINQHGAVCLSTLSNDWTPEMTLFNVFEALISLLYTYDLDGPLVDSIAKIYKNDPSEFERNARLWTQRYSICTFDP